MTLDNTHSLHVTLSVYQRNSWCDLLEKLLPQALQRAATSDSSFRKGLPLDYLRCTGTAYDNDDSRNLIFKKQVKEMLTRLIDYIDVDNAVDLLAKNHIHDFLPPVLTKDEQKCSVVEDGDVMLAKGVVKSCAGITTNTRIRLTRSHCVRYVTPAVAMQFVKADARYLGRMCKYLISSRYQTDGRRRHVQDILFDGELEGVSRVRAAVPGGRGEIRVRH